MANLRGRILPFVISATICATSSACGLMDDIVPRTAADAGQDSVAVNPIIDTGGTRSLPPSITGVELEILDVLLHDPQDDVWLILNDHSINWQPFEPGAEVPEFSEMPVVVGTYDALEIRFGEARVQSGGTWSEATLTESSLRISKSVKVSSDLNLSILFDFGAAFARSKDGAWTLTPAVEVQWD